ncbi:protein ABHD13-like [Hylaeus volcanicus]|uniref:protein ABHD13-like n=1 Tax=Hylaeus volcanicus TaxID=313075 RepID=UPI0023B77E74|nr:protein ABHD13-like [Hylaeus volcanicus]
MGNSILFPTAAQKHSNANVHTQSHIVWIPSGSFYSEASPACFKYHKGRLPYHGVDDDLKFPALWFNGRRRCVLLYFHGNSTNLVDIFEEMEMLSLFLDCCILAIEYPGYGLCADLRVNPSTIDYWGLAAFFWILNLGANSEDIILFGRSIGTGPATKLASTLVQVGLQPGGLVLHSPFLSIHKIVCDYSSIGTWFIKDYWNTEEFLKGISPHTPLVIIHGENDEIIPVYHGHKLFNDYKVPDSMKAGYFPKNSKHNEYYVIEDLAIPIQNFFKHRNLFQYLPLTKMLNPTNQTETSVLYNFKFILSIDENQNKTTSTDTSESSNNASLLNKIRFFHVKVTNKKKTYPSLQHDASETLLEPESPNVSNNMLAVITQFDDIPISEYVTT